MKTDYKSVFGFHKFFPASGQKMERVRGRKFFAREPTGFFSAAKGGGFYSRRGFAPPADYHRFFRFLFLDLWIKFGKIIEKV